MCEWNTRWFETTHRKHASGEQNEPGGLVAAELLIEARRREASHARRERVQEQSRHLFLHH